MTIEAYWLDNPLMVERAWKVFDEAVLDTGDRLGDVAPQWERDAFAATLGLPGAPSGDNDMVEICGPVGCGKDQIIALTVMAALKYGPKGFKGLKQSTSKDKSKEVVDTVHGFIARNDALGHGLEVVRDEVRCVCPACKKDRCLGCEGNSEGSRGGKVVCASLDGPTAAGVRADIMWINEVQEWPSPRGNPTYDHLFTRYDKKGGRFVCFTNAPFTERGEWRRERWEEAKREGSDWYYHQVSVYDCPWLLKSLEKKRRNMTPQKFRRWYFCEPTDGRGDLVGRDELNACVINELVETRDPAIRAGQRFLGVDLAYARDHAALVLLCRTPDDAVVLERVDVWQPSEGQQIQLDEVEARVREYLKTWRARGLFDPYQAIQMVQGLERDGFDVQAVASTAINLTEMCGAVRELVRDKRLRLYPNAGDVLVSETNRTSLIQQIVDAEVKESERGERIVSKRNNTGHGDQLSAFALAAWGVVKATRAGRVWSASAGDAPADEGRDRTDRRGIRDIFKKHFGKRPLEALTGRT